MLIDDDEFWQNMEDNTYGYAPATTRKRQSKSMEFSRTMSDKDFQSQTGESNQSPPAVSFLNVQPNSCQTESFAVETAIRAGCSSDGLRIARCQREGPSALVDLASKLSDSDAALLSAQLDRELKCEWRSSSLSCLEADRSYMDGSDSILRMYDNLCNMNLQLIVMQRELLQHENLVCKLRENEKMNALGYEDPSNRTQLQRVMWSLNTSLSDLQNRLRKLNCALTGCDSEDGKAMESTSFLHNLFLPVGFTLLTILWFARHAFMKTR